MSDYKKYTILLQTLADASGSVESRNEIMKLIDVMKGLENQSRATATASESVVSASSGMSSALGMTQFTEARGELYTLTEVMKGLEDQSRATSTAMASVVSGSSGLSSALGMSQFTEKNWSETQAQARALEQQAAATHDVAVATGEQAKAAAAGAGAFVEMDDSARQLLRSLEGIGMVSRGNVAGGLKMLGGSATTLVAALGPVLAVLGALAGGYKFGATIDGILGISDAAGRAAGESDKAVDALKTMSEVSMQDLAKALAGIQQFDLANMLGQIDAFAKGTAAIAANTERMAQAQRDYEIALVRGRVARVEVTPEQGRVLEADIGAKSDLERLRSEESRLRERRELEIAARETAKANERNIQQDLTQQQEAAKQAAQSAGVALDPKSIAAAREQNAAALAEEKNRISWQPQSEETRAQMVAEAEAKAQARAAELDAVAAHVVALRRLQNELAEARKTTAATSDATGTRIGDINRQIQENQLRQRTVAQERNNVVDDVARQEREKAAKEAKDAADKQAEEDRKAAEQQAAIDLQKRARYTVQYQRRDNTRALRTDGNGNPVYDTRVVEGGSSQYEVGATTPDGGRVTGRALEPDDVFVRRKASEFARQQAAEAAAAAGTDKAGAETEDARVASAMASDLQSKSPELLSSIARYLGSVGGDMEKLMEIVEQFERNWAAVQRRLADIESREKGNRS